MLSGGGAITSHVAIFALGRGLPALCACPFFRRPAHARPREGPRSVPEVRRRVVQLQGQRGAAAGLRGGPGENPKNLFDFTRRSHPRAPDGVLRRYLPSEQAYLTGLDAGQKNDPSITQERNPFEELVHEQVSFGPGSAQRWS